MYQWCVRNDVKARQRFFDGGLFATEDSVSVDVLAIHVDGDLREVLSDQEIWKSVAPIDPGGFAVSSSGRYDFASAVVAHWLFRGEEDVDKSIGIPAVQQSEAWLLGALGYSPTPEEIDDPKLDFARYFLGVSGKPIPAKMSKLKHHHRAIEATLQKNTPDTAALLRTAPAFKSAVDGITQTAGV